MRGFALVCLSSLTASSAPLAGDDEAAASLQAVPEGHCVVLPEELVDPAVTAEWSGRTVAFCCKRCRQQFLANPEAFASLLPPLPPTPAASQAAAPAASAATPGDANRPASWRAWLGRLHPLIVHFPVALLVLAGATEVLVRPGDVRWRARARFLLSLGAPLAVVTALLGWLAALESGYPTMTGVLFRHRWLGIATALCAVVALALAPSARTPEVRRERLYRWMLLATVVLVALAGHHGATLVFGPGWLSLPR